MRRNHLLRSRHLNGYKRLGIFCSGLWVLVAVTVYYLGISFCPSSLTNLLHNLYDWVQGPAEVVGMKPNTPTADDFKLCLFILLPICTGWLVLFILPRSLRWVKDGFRQKHHHDHDASPDASRDSGTVKE